MGKTYELCANLAKRLRVFACLAVSAAGVQAAGAVAAEAVRPNGTAVWATADLHVRDGKLCDATVGALLLAGCGGQGEGVRIESIADMKGRRLGCLTGSAYQECTEPIQEGIRYLTFNDLSAEMLALKEGKIEGVTVDEPIARYWVARKPGDYRIAQTYTTDNYAFAFKKGSALRKEFDAVIRRLEADGSLKRYAEKWCDAASADIALETLDARPGHTGSRGTIKMSISPDLEPAAYLDRGEVVGLEVDIARRIAWELDMKLVIVQMSFDALIASVNSGKADFAGATIVVTEERKKSVDFSLPHYTGGLSLLVRGEGAGAGGSFFGGLATSFKRTFVEGGRWRDILAGLGETVFITVFAVLLGTILAFPVWMLRTSKRPLAKACGDAFVTILQGTPILVILMILYYVVFATCDIPGELVAIVAFALNFAAYGAEMLRSGIAAVPDGQREAALAIGFTPFEAFRRVVFPQSLRHILPVYSGEVVGLLKGTSIVGYISVVDLTKASDLVRARTYEAFFPLIATAAIYFLIARLIIFGLDRINHTLIPIVRRKKGGAA